VVNVDTRCFRIPEVLERDTAVQTKFIGQADARLVQRDVVNRFRELACRVLTRSVVRGEAECFTVVFSDRLNRDAIPPLGFLITRTRRDRSGETGTERGEDPVVLEFGLTHELQSSVTGLSSSRIHRRGPRCVRSLHHARRASRCRPSERCVGLPLLRRA